MIILISGKLVQIKLSVIIKLLTSGFLSLLSLSPNSGWTEGGGLTRLYCTCIEMHFKLHERAYNQYMFKKNIINFTIMNGTNFKTVQSQNLLSFMYVFLTLDTWYDTNDIRNNFIMIMFS